MQNELNEISMKVKRTDRLESKPSRYLWEYHYDVYVVDKILIPRLVKTNITPNQITFFGFIFAMFSLICLYNHYHILAGISFFIYATADWCDGKVARYKNMTSKLGHYFDAGIDLVTYNVVFIIAYTAYDTNGYILLFMLFAFNLHSLVATLYIVPNLKKLTKIYRFGIKKYFMDKNLILGADIVLFTIIVIFACLFEIFNLSMFLIGIAYFFDMLYRLHELKINQVIESLKNH